MWSRISLALAGAGAALVLGCSSSPPAPAPGGSAGGSGSGGGGGCGTGTTYCPTYNICILDNCQYWCQAGGNLYCSASAPGPGGCTGPVHDGCNSAGGSGSSGAGGSGSSGSGGGCAAGTSYCASCNVCIPNANCPYWCQEGSQGACSTSPSGLTGCTGPVHAGCDCTTGGSSSSGGAGGSGSGSSGGATCHSLTSCVQVNVNTNPGGCTAGVAYDVIDNCGQPAYCRVCAVTSSGAVDDNECQAFTVNGSNAGQDFCGSQYVNVRYACGETSDPTSCVRTF